MLGVGDDDRFTTFAGRVDTATTLEAIMAAWCAARDSDEVFDTSRRPMPQSGP